MKSKHKYLIANTLSILVVVLAAISIAITLTGASSYFLAKAAWFLGVAAVLLSIINLAVSFILLLVFLFIKGRRRFGLSEFGVSFTVYFVITGGFYTWMRNAYHFPSENSVHWRERALYNLRNEIIPPINDSLIPDRQDWHKTFKDSGYDFLNTIQTWEHAFNSTILINENIKGKSPYDIDGYTVLMFEGPKGLFYGDQATFNRFAAENDYVYLVLVNGKSGRIRTKDGKRDSFYSYFYESEKPILWD